MSPIVNTYAPSFLIIVNGTELRHGVTVDVLSVSVTETFNQADRFDVMVRDRHPEAGRIFAGGDQLEWMDSDVFDEGNEVEIHMGYADDLHLMLRGEVTAASPSFPSSGQPTLSVQGASLYHRLQRETRRQPFEAATDSGIAEEIASAMGLEAEVDATEAEHPLVSPSGESYAAILQQRAQRIGYEVAVKDHTLYFQRPRYIDNPSATLTLEWGRDLISFSPRLSTHDAATEVTVRGSQTSQGRGKEPIVGTAQVGDQRVTMGEQTGQQVAQEAFGERHVLVDDHNVASQQEANEMARARLETQAMDYIQGGGSCVGNPELKSRTVVELTGLGRRFSGIYYITSTTHRIDSGGYLTSFEVKRNAR
jgi:phage protein D